MSALVPCEPAPYTKIASKTSYRQSVWNGMEKEAETHKHNQTINAINFQSHSRKTIKERVKRKNISKKNNKINEKKKTTAPILTESAQNFVIGAV